MNGVIIDRVKSGEVGLLQQISRQTFVEAFGDRNTPENMQQYLDSSLSIERLLEELNNPDSTFYFARYEGSVVGYLKLNEGASQTEIKQSKALEIERIYVLQEFLGKKVGQLLYEKAVAKAKDANAAYIWLGVWEENKRAIRFYEKNGFVAFDKHVFYLGDDAQTDVMMRLMLQ